MNIATFLELRTTAAPDDVAVTDGTSSLTASQLRAAAVAAARWCREEGFTSVVYVGPNDVQVAVALFASAWAGIPFVPLNYRLPAEQLADLVARHPGAALIADDEPRQPPTTVTAVSVEEWTAQAARAEARDADSPPDELSEAALTLYTSGTTSEPKPVVLRHRHLSSYVLDAVEFGGAQPDEATLVSVPPYHIAGIANLLSNLYAGRRVVYLPAFSAAGWLATASAERVTNAMVVPTMLARIVDELDRTGDAPPATLRALSYGGAKTPRPVLERVLRHFEGVALVNGYGLTETSSTIALLSPEDHDRARAGEPAAVKRLDSVGRVVPMVEVQVCDSDGRPLPPGGVGEIRVRGAQVSGEYGERSALDGDGWFATRDLGWLDGDGYLFVEGRMDDTIIRGGENIAPAEIEAVLSEHRAIADVAVVGVPDEEWGESIGAAVVLGDPDVTPEEILEWARSRLRRSKTPAHLRVVAELPYSDTGKLVRRRLRELFAVDRSRERGQEPAGQVP